ncbi:PREDICTED: vitrin-like [Branchiostoma belcheri]|uniref:Vitrin-like n=1 Tax=Branchiostoma belcheri TaxID=7741 RepID=A0A6P4YNY2_BRABE|nr:PREDICTED: vitrin-like [Branchiostoma belcheri]
MEEPTCDEKVDIMVLMDGSASVGRRNFPDVRNFVLSLAAGFRIGAGAAQLGVYQYAIRVQKEIGLNQFNNREVSTWAERTASAQNPLFSRFSVDF